MESSHPTGHTPLHLRFRKSSLRKLQINVMAKGRAWDQRMERRLLDSLNNVDQSTDRVDRGYSISALPNDHTLGGS
jgi:hypothetical protein